ncbi:MAG TPA: cupin domain-containing protein [Solirubrobacteraceae bacterium]|nr:cupin domain-containing protein [Solirubrobacteraceae bacterium]
MSETIETTTSVTVIHGAMLSFESIGAVSRDEAPVRLREHHETLLRVIDGTVVLAIEDSERTMSLEDEARIPAATPHRIYNVSETEARIVQELRRAS